MKFIDENIIWNGRYLDHENVRYFDFSASGFEFSFTGKKIVATVLSNPQDYEEGLRGVLGIFVTHADGKEDFFKVRLDKKENKITLFEAGKEETVEIKVIRLSEAVYGYSGLKSLEFDGVINRIESKKGPKIEVIGDSITCGYGIEGVYEKDIFTTMHERPDLAYAYLTMKNLNADFHLVSRSGIGLISCYTDPQTVKLPNTAEPLMSQLWPYTDRYLCKSLGIDQEVWDASKFQPDVVILHLGTNDASWVRGLEDRRISFVNLYEQMLEAIHRRSPKAKIVCCLGAMGQDLCDSEEEALRRFAVTFPNVKTTFVKFPVQDEANDGVCTDWHPSAKTHKKMADLLTKALKEFI